MKLKSGYIENRHGDELFVAITEAPAASGLVVMCPPLLEEATYCRLDYRGVARQLIELGFSVVEFDYAGTGDSTGEHLEADLKRRADDIEVVVTAATTACNGAGNLILFGMRGGANLCLDAAHRDNTRRAIAWFPVTDGNAVIEDWLQVNTMTQYAAFGSVRFSKNQLLETLADEGAINVQGFQVSEALVSQVRRLDLSCLPVAKAGQAQVVLEKTRDSATLARHLESQGYEAHETAARRFWQSPRMLEPAHPDPWAHAARFLAT
ncbi:MAG: hypothetical protein KDI19_08840 [Pseudomonadales bacterium]|nr:hypothetical protein [Pseudomonadales bacterium]